MRRFATTIGTLLLASLVGLTGCDNSPTSVEDFPVQANLVTPNPEAIAVSRESSPEFEVSYQGLQEPPTAEVLGSQDIRIEVLSQEGNPQSEASSRFRASLDTDVIDSPIKNIPVLLSGTTSGGETVTDTISAFSSTKLSVRPDFSSSFISLADYEGDVDSTTYCGQSPDTEPYEGGQRAIQTSGASVSVTTSSDAENTPSGSNGIRFLGINTTSAGGSATIQRRMNLPNSDEFSFLVRASTVQQFDLTLGFTEEDGGSETTYEYTIPIPRGIGWIKIGVPFSEISDDFTPVASRSGGDGPLVSVTLTADASVSYAVDELLFGAQATGPRAELHDFERSPCAYGPPFSGGTFGFTDDVADQSDGFTARTLEGIGFFGYNFGAYGDSPSPAFLNVDGDDVLSFLGKGIGDDRELYVFLEGPGNFTNGSGQTNTLPEGRWKRFEIPLSELGDDPSALSEGLSNVGFGGCSNCVVDDLKILPK